MKKHEANWIKKLGYRAITFGDHVFIDPEYFNDKKLLEHEMVHVKQYARDGFAKFILKYLGEYFFNLIKYRNHNKAYRNISYEKEAYGETT